MATTSEIEKLLSQNIKFAESGYTRGKGITPSDFQKFLDNGKEIHRYCDYLRGKAENGTITDEETRLLEKLAENHAAWTPEYITMFNSEPMEDAPTERADREKYHGLAMDHSKAMQFVEKGTAEGLTPEEYRDYQNTVSSLRGRVKQYQADMASGPITKHEKDLLNKVLETQGTWEKHDDKPFIVDGKEVDDNYEPPHSEPTHSGVTPRTGGKSHGKKEKKGEAVDGYRREKIEEAKEQFNIVMRLAKKGTKKGLSKDEEKAYRKAVKCLNRRANVLAGMADNGNASAEEIDLLHRLQNTRGTWDKHNGKPLKINEKGDSEERPEPPRRYEPSPLDIPLLSEAIDEFAQAFGYGTYGDKRDRISYLFGAWLKNRAAEAAEAAKERVVDYIKESFENFGQNDESEHPHDDDLDEQYDDESGDLYEGNDPEFTAFLFNLAENALKASKGDEEALDWLDNEGQELFDYWYKQEVWGGDQAWYDDPRLIDDLKASFEIMDLDEDGNPIDAELDDLADGDAFTDDADQPDPVEWVDQQRFDEMEAYLAEHPFIASARNLWLRTFPSLDRMRDASSGLWNTIKNIIVKPAIEISQMSDEEWRRKTDPIKERQRIWVDSYTKSDGTRVKGHNKTITKNAR